MTTPKATDPRFLSLHPRTALWFEQREQCWLCAHLEWSGPGGSSSMSCGVVPKSDEHGRVTDRTCISARDVGGACGPGATVFVLNEGAV